MDATAENSQVLFFPWSSHIADHDFRLRTSRRKFRIVVEEFVESIDDIHAELDCPEHQCPLGGREHATRWSDPEYKVVRNSTAMPDSIIQVLTDGDTVRLVIKECSCIQTGPLTVNDRFDLIFLRMTDKTVGCLSVNAAEIRLAIYDGGR